MAKAFYVMGVCVAVLIAAGGCSGSARTISMELAAPEGVWRLDGIETASLDLSGWRIRVVDSKVATFSAVPLLETLVLEITNTSAVEPLVVPVDAVKIGGLTDTLFIGPIEEVVLRSHQSRIVAYRPGLRAQHTAYPFDVRVTVHRPGGPEQTVKLLLY